MTVEIPVQDLVDLGYVAPLPVIARRRIQERFRIDDIEGYAPDCEGFNVLREIADRLDPDEKFRHAVFLSACHTHWDDNKIIESFDATAGHYLNGPRPNVDTGILKPYSFAFSRHGALPVEWMDDSVPINEHELNELYDWIAEFNDEVQKELYFSLPLPIGIMIDHRFKTSLWEPRIFSFAEGDSEEFDGRAKVVPIFESIIDPAPAMPNTVQVTWSAFGKAYFAEVPAASQEEREFFRHFEGAIAAQPAMGAREFADAVESLLSN